MADFYSGGDEYGIGKSKVNDVYLVHSPLARQTFYELTLSNQPIDTRMYALHQVLEGLAHLHKHGIMHRDIKPTNMMIVSYQPIHAIIIDYGSATFDTRSTDHMCGTIAYLAPEVLRLKYEKTIAPESYDCLVDIWSMGLSAFQLFFQEPCRWEKGVNTIMHKEVVKKLKAKPNSVANVIGRMLSWQSDQRPSAEEILKFKLWSKYSNQGQAEDAGLITEPDTKRPKR
jgi:serine/threonine protein kinase